MITLRMDAVRPLTRFTQKVSHIPRPPLHIRATLPLFPPSLSSAPSVQFGAAHKHHPRQLLRIAITPFSPHSHPGLARVHSSFHSSPFPHWYSSLRPPATSHSQNTLPLDIVDLGPEAERASNLHPMCSGCSTRASLYRLSEALERHAGRQEW